MKGKKFECKDKKPEKLSNRLLTSMRRSFVRNAKLREELQENCIESSVAQQDKNK